MHHKAQIAVLGGGGRTGKYLITQLIKKGYRIKVLLRNTETFTIKSTSIQIVVGDALDYTVVDSLINDCLAVISTIGQRPAEPLVAEAATRNVLQAMAKYGIKRYMVVAGINIDMPYDQKGDKTTAATNWMKATYPAIQEDRQKAYSLLVDSDMDWTLIRVPFIEFSDANGELMIELSDCSGDKINAGNIAFFLVEQVFEDRYYHKAPFISNT